MSKKVPTTEAEMLAAEAALDEKPEPVHISGTAHKHYASMFRLWSGWDEAGIVFGDPAPYSPWAFTDFDTKTLTLNPTELILNPNRLLLTMTPYRMKQEAVLTGTVLHEAGHARFSLWIPKNAKEAGQFNHTGNAGKFLKGTPVNAQTLAFARLLEEARVEGFMARNANQMGAIGLAWTMRAAAAHLIPRTVLSTDPGQRVMDVISTWVQRAGRHLALNHWITSHGLNNWVNDMTSFCEQEIQQHLFNAELNGAKCSPMVDSQRIMSLMMEMLWHADHKGRGMVDHARKVLDLLYPEQDGDDDGAPQPNAGCKGQPQPENGEGEDQPEQTPEQQAEQQATQDLMEELEAQADQDSGQTEAESQAEQDQADKSEDKPDKKQSGNAGGQGKAEEIQGKFRQPTPAEREIKKGAEKFLRSLIDPSTSSKVVLTSSPSATVDGAALAAWKAGGQINEPHFFKRTKRTRTMAPPIKIAVLVDVSSSMEVLQKPSALLSWAMAAACLDLRNFAGRGTQVESTLIHWGDRVETIQKNGQIIPGIREVECRQGTSAMHLAFERIEEEIPGFFDAAPADKPVSRLIVQFTDWQLFSHCERAMVPKMAEALGNGVNMLTVFPNSYSANRSDLPGILGAVPIQRGRSTVMTYDSASPGQVWDTASKALPHKE